jgi:hypothetical protein
VVPAGGALFVFVVVGFGKASERERGRERKEDARPALSKKKK